MRERTTSQGVLEDLELGPRWAERATKRGEFAHFETAIFGQHCRIGTREFLADLFDDGHLLRSGHDA